MVGVRGFTISINLNAPGAKLGLPIFVFFCFFRSPPPRTSFPPLPLRFSSPGNFSSSLTLWPTWGGGGWAGVPGKGEGVGGEKYIGWNQIRNATIKWKRNTTENGLNKNDKTKYIRETTSHVLF
uniref:Uncharacterized protein n=1 Tax=Cacopsylla melanoneura TaxID=428564 RepID=A0A8D8R404_9HEMI